MNHVNSVEQITVRSKSSWRLSLDGFAVVAVAFIALYWTTGYSLVATWARTGMFQYAFLIFPISGWLIWRQRHELAATHEPSVCIAAMPLLAATVFVWLLGRIANVDVLQHAAFVATLPVLVLVFFGVSVARALMFPLVYLIFAIPAGQSAVGPLQTVTATMSVKFLQWSGVPVLLNGHFITTPWMVAHVAEACSGIRFFLACTALGSLFAYLMFTSYWRRFAFIVASMIVPIIANGLRVYFTILIGGTFGLQYAEGTDHLIFGWQFFGTVLFLLFLAGWFLREPPQEIESRGAVDGSTPIPWPRMLAAVAGTLAVLVAATASAAWMQRGAIAKTGPAIIALAAPQGWTASAGGFDWQPRFAGADRRLAAHYTDGSRQVMLFAAAYSGAQINGHDLLAYENGLFDRDRWSIGDSRIRTVTLTGGSTFAARQLVLQSRFGRRMVWYWYRVDDRRLTDKAWVRGWQAWEQLNGASLNSAVVAIATDFPRGEAPRAAATLEHFLRAVYPRLESAIVGRGEHA